MKSFAASAAKGARRASSATLSHERSFQMADEFPELDLDTETPTADDLAHDYGSKFLGVDDVGSRRIRTRIVKVRREDIRDRDTGRTKKRAVVYFENVDKPLILNVTNKLLLEEALGKAPADWIGASIGIFVDPNVGFGGKKTGGVRLSVLLPASKPAAKPAAKAEWPEEEGDPGHTGAPDFGPAE
jgi:hypothetical protein